MPDTAPALSRFAPVVRQVVGCPVFARADDIGLSLGTNLAADECTRDGVVRNVSVLAVGPQVRHAALLFAGRDDVAIGCHLALTCEWANVRFGPASMDDHTAPLTGADGGFGPSADWLLRRGVDCGVILREAAAQLSLLRGLGLTVNYLDTHMGVSWLPGAFAALDGFCREEGLLFFDDVQRRCRVVTASPTKRAAGDGRPVVWIGHPMRAVPDEETPYGPGLPVETVAAARDAERQAFLRPLGTGFYPARADAKRASEQ